MRPEAFDCVTVTSYPGQLPICIEQSNGTWSRLPGLALMSGLAVVIVAPQVALATYVVAAPSARHAVAAEPVAALALAIALTAWIALVCWPLRQGLLRLARRRTVEISGGVVTVKDRHPLGCETWSAPLTAFSGVAHHVRSSLSGVRHELVLAHPNPRRSVVLSVGEQIARREATMAAEMLRLPEIAPDALYGPTTRRRVKISSALPTTAALSHEHA